MSGLLRQYGAGLSIAAMAVAAFVVPAFIDVFALLAKSTSALHTAVFNYTLGAILAVLIAVPTAFWHKSRVTRDAIREQTKAQDIARHLANHDELTGLYNRRYLFEQLHKMIHAAERGSGLPAVILLNLDRFNPLNDLRGPQTGDLILQQVARRISTSCATGQHVVRFGGDEFAILLEETDDLEHSERLVHRIVAALEVGFEMPGGSVRLSCSMGVAVWKPGLTSAVLVKNASQAMHQAKSDGRARASYFHEGLGEKLRLQAELENDLARAIDTGEILPYFQPLVDLPSGNLLGFEVLARWISPKHGMVPPDRFISVAEDTGLIGPLTWKLLRRACSVLSGWDPSLSIAFNISPHQFSDPEFARKIGSILRDAGVAGSRLEIEITENAVIKDIENAKGVIDELHKIGVRISLDDFGTGYSSLATLNQLPFDKLKIDRSFVFEIGEQVHSAKIVQGILLLAASLDLVVTAEGIETPAQLQFLVDHNCDQGQGYYFSRPLPLEEVEMLMDAEWKDGMLPIDLPARMELPKASRA